VFLGACLESALVAQAIAPRTFRATAGEFRTATLRDGVPSMTTITSARTTPPLEFPIRVETTSALEPSGLRLVIPPATPAGKYTIDVAGDDEIGRPVSATLQVTVDAVTVSPAATARIPVVLLNGFQLVCTNNASTVAASVDFFGQLASLLQSDGAPVVFFNNCTYHDISIEQLAGLLNNYIAGLQYTDGTPVTQVDLVAHSMGGLIARSYLAGKGQTSGAFSPPANPKVRKLVMIATPHFGSFAVGNIGTQESEMAGGSQFIWDLATWNQRQDDLRGVDALAIIGNAGTSNTSDGVVSLTSGSLGFAQPGQRTRIVPYCHTTPGFLTGLGMSCSNYQGIADINDASHLSAQIVRSFLADTTAWQSVGTVPAQDQYLSKYGGMVVADVNTNDQYVSPSTVSWGSVALTRGAAGYLYYNDMVNGTGSFAFGSSTCGPFTEPIGFYSAVRCKFAPTIYSVGPMLSVPGSVVQAGTTITIAGAGFGAQQCGTCRVTASNPQSTVLQVSSWSDTSIRAFLPASFVGIATIGVTTANGSDALNIMAALASTIAVAPTSLQFAYTVGGTVPAAQGVSISNTGGVPLSWTASASAAWVGLSSASGTTPVMLFVSVNPATLPARSYSATVLITATGAIGSSASVSVTLVVQAPQLPTVNITAVGNGASFQAGFASATWVSIFGTNLSQTTRTWQNSDFVNGLLPTSLGGVSVTVNGLAAYVEYISPTQVNVLAPDDTAVGAVQVQVTTAQGKSNDLVAQKQQFAPAFFTIGGSSYAAAQHADYSYVGKPGLIAGVTTQPAKPGEIILLYGTGFGPTSPPLPCAQLVTTPAPLANSVHVTIGGVDAPVAYAGLVEAGLYQFNVTVPSVPGGDAAVVAQIGGVPTQTAVSITIQQ
jgi:uncharacterized protein (TIGR03437 family)